MKKPPTDDRSPAEKLADAKSKLRPAANKKPVKNKTWTCALRRIREALGLSFDDVANAVKLSKSGYWQIEQGSDPMLTTAYRLAEFFDLSVHDIWPSLNEPTETPRRADK